MQRKQSFFLFFFATPGKNLLCRLTNHVYWTMHIQCPVIMDSLSISKVFVLLTLVGLHSSQRAEAGCYYKKKRFGRKLFKFKKISIKQAFFINEIFSSRVEASKRKKIWSFFSLFFKGFLRFFLVLVLVSKFEIFKTFLNIKISNFY